MSALELEKKHKRNLETLKQEIEDRNITIESLNVELKKVRKREEELDRKVKRDEDKKINEHQKPPR
jgi:cell division protein FtsB